MSRLNRWVRPLGLIAAMTLLVSAAPPPQPTAAAQVAQSRALLEKGDFIGAYLLAERTIAQFPQDPGAMLLAGNLVRDRYGLTAALPWYDRVLEINPRSVAAMIDKAAALGDAGRTVEMLAMTRQVLAVDPKQPMAFFLQSVLAARADKWDLARALYERTRGQLDAVPAVMLLRGALGLKTGGLESAIAALRPLVAAQPGNRAARHLLGLALLRGGDAQGAIDTLKPISNDGDSWAQTVMARACEAVGDRLGAAILLDRAANPVSTGRAGLALDVAMTAANTRFTPASGFHLIDAFNRAGDAKRGEDAMATLVDQFPASLPVLKLAASDALSRREWGRAATTLELTLVRGGKGDAQALGDLAWARFNLGDTAAARDLAAQAYALSPGNAGIAAGYGWFLAQAGDKPGGVALLQKAVTLAPGYAPFQAKLADAAKL
jgi:cellulose synthase operon protein C